MCSRDSSTFHSEHLRNRVSAYVGEKLAGQDANGGTQSTDIGQIDKSEGEDEDFNAVQQSRLHDRSNQKHKQESRQRAKTFQPSDCQLVTISVRVRGRRSVSSATDVVERAILPDCADQLRIAKT